MKNKICLFTKATVCCCCGGSDTLHFFCFSEIYLQESLSHIFIPCLSSSYIKCKSGTDLWNKTYTCQNNSQMMQKCISYFIIFQATTAKILITSWHCGAAKTNRDFVVKQCMYNVSILEALLNICTGSRK